MSQANDLPPDPKRAVASGYDRIAERYLRWTRERPAAVRRRYLELLMSRVPAGGRVLDLGCGAGDPMTRMLAQRYDVVGVDISARQLALARRRVPTAHLVRGDIARPCFSASAFDAVTAFYAIIHVPRSEHAGLLADILRILRPGGIFLGTMGAHDLQDLYEPDWLGAPTFFSHFDGETNRRLVEAAGFRIEVAQVEGEMEDGDYVEFLWIMAQKPAEP